MRLDQANDGVEISRQKAMDVYEGAERRAHTLRRRSLLVRNLGIFLVAVGVVVGSVALGGSLSGAGDSTAPVAAGDLDSFLAYFSHGDYEPVSTPAALARQADIVVVGRLVAARPGALYAYTPESEPEVATSVLEVHVDQVITGNDALVHDGSLYIEMSFPAFYGTGKEDGELLPFDHEAFAKTLPSTRGMFFVDDRSESRPDTYVIDEGAGLPAGAVRTATYAQGFLIEDSQGRLVSVRAALDEMSAAWRSLGSLDEVVAASQLRPPGE